MPEAIRISARHPALPGHFPGRPIIPGALLLQHVIEAAPDLPEARAITGVRRMKFLRMIAPEESFFVEFDPPGASGLRFRVRSADGPVAEGQLALSQSG